MHKLKKLKSDKPNGPNPIAEAAIQAAKASSALQNFQINDKRKKDKKVGNIDICNCYIVCYNVWCIADGAIGWRSSVGRSIVVRVGRR